MPVPQSGEWIGAQYTLTIALVCTANLCIPNSQRKFLARSFKKYLAIATLSSASHAPVVGRKVTRPSYSCIQIWSLSSLRLERQSGVEKSSNKNINNEQMKCEIVLCLDTGPAHDIKWCPLPSHDLVGLRVVSKVFD
jgi:hypothetical protein